MEEPIPFPVRINRYLALRGLATRSAADALISAGRVTVNGKKAVLGQKVMADDQVEIERKGAEKKEYRYIAYYKPRGIITHSPQAKEKEISDIYPVKGVFPVGRLDKASEGLIILTDDGRVTERLLHPRFVHEKEYEVKVREDLSPSLIPKFTAGIKSEGEELRAKSARLIDRHRLSIVLTEGKKHQIRRMLSELHVTVERLERVRIMDIRLGDLGPGDGRFLTGQEKQLFLDSLNLVSGA